MRGWGLVATLGMLITLYSCYHSTLFKDVDKGWFINSFVTLFIFHTLGTFLLPIIYNLLSYQTIWGNKFFQCILFWMCLILSGVPSYVSIGDITSVWPMYGLTLWGLGLELALQARANGNILNMTLCVSYSVGITLFHNDQVPWYDSMMLYFTLPFLYTIIYQALAPKAHQPAIIDMCIRLRHPVQIHPDQLYRFEEVDRPGLYTFSLVPHGPGPIRQARSYRLVAERPPEGAGWAAFEIVQG